MPSLLAEEFTVYQPADNCRFAKYTLHGVLYDWAKEIDESDVIHWNNGLWVSVIWATGCLPPEEYAANMIRIAKALQTKAGIEACAEQTARIIRESVR